MSLWINANESLAERRAVPADGRTSAQGDTLFARVRAIAHQGIDNAKLDSHTAAAVRSRFDAACDKVTADNFSDYRRKFSGDAAGAEGGALFAGALRAVLGTVLEEKHTVPNGLKAFKPDTSLAVGVRTFEVRREYSSGEARVHRGGRNGIPTVGIANATMEFKVHNYVTSVVYDAFEEMAANYANVQLAAKLMRIARFVLEQFANEMIFFGDPSYRIFGVLNYPWLDKQVSASNWYGTPADSRAVLTELNGYLNRQFFASKGVFGPNKIATSPRVASWINQQPMGTTTVINDRTIGEVFRAGAGGRLSGDFEQWHELENVLGDGIDAMLFYRDDEMGITNVLPGGGIQALPFFSDDIERRQILFMPHGGVVMQEVGNMLLVFVNATA